MSCSAAAKGNHAAAVSGSSSAVAWAFVQLILPDVVRRSVCAQAINLSQSKQINCFASVCQESCLRS